LSAYERRLMAAQQVTPMPGAHERRVAERTRSARLIRDSISLLSSKWSVDILLALGDGTRRYHELLEDLQPISEKVLTQTLRGMERDGLVARRVHAEVPPRVEYALTPKGEALLPIIDSMREYGSHWLGATADCAAEAQPVVVAVA
jgi:DNA-binding HxlR family transcriptional regulator